MRKIDHLAIRDVLRKRQARTTNNSLHNTSMNEPTLLTTNKQQTIDQVIQKILKHESKTIHRCELNNQQKNVIIQFMSQRENISFNRNTLAALMTIWRVPGVCYFDNSKEARKNRHLDTIFGPKGIKNVFLLSGQIGLFQRTQIQKPKVVTQSSQESYQLTFQTQSINDNLSTLLEGQEPKIILQEHIGIGPLFRHRQQQDRQKSKNLNNILRITNAIFVQVKPPQLQSMLINIGGMDQQKKYKIIQQFPIFSSISKKIQSILPYIERKKFTKNENIYRVRQNPDAIYLILKGQIIFEVKIQLPKPKKVTNANKNLPNQVVIQTQALGIGNYFGQEEIIFKSTRNVNSICNSAECDLLEIPAQKFQRLLTYSDFYEQVKTSAQVKIKKRKQKIQKALQIYLQFSQSSQKMPQEDSSRFERKTATLDNRRASTKKKASQPIVMHGNIIRKIPPNSHSEVINFSMLKANPDMYDATLKKFRKYTMKPIEKYKPQVNWDLKRVWKVLNLQNILREDTQVSSPEGRKFFQSHRRLQNHVQQVKSLRPKTSSSTYRTKLQYIAYLQQFNG